MVQRIKEIIFNPENYSFPLKRAYDENKFQIVNRELPDIEKADPNPAPPIEADIISDESRDIPNESRSDVPNTPFGYPVEKVQGGYMVGSVFVKHYKGSTKPPHVLPHFWRNFTPKQKQEEIQKWEKWVAESENTAAPCIAVPACVLDPIPAMPCREYIPEQGS
jgi:hypothetical protein